MAQSLPDLKMDHKSWDDEDAVDLVPQDDDKYYEGGN